MSHRLEGPLDPPSYRDLEGGPCVVIETVSLSGEICQRRYSINMSTTLQHQVRSVGAPPWTFTWTLSKKFGPERVRLKTCAPYWRMPLPRRPTTCSRVRGAPGGFSSCIY